MEASLTDTVREVLNDYWPHVSGLAIAAAGAAGTAIFSFIRRPKSSPTEIGPYFTEAPLLTPPLRRPAYSDRMAYVLAEMSDLAYYQFEGQRGFVDDAVDSALKLDMTDDTNVREFLEMFSTQLMSGRRLQVESMKKLLANSGFLLLDVIDISETQGFVCKRVAENEPPYLVLAFRGTEKKVSDWLTDAHCIPTIEGRSKVHTGFLEAFTKKTNAEGKTVQQAVEQVLAKEETRDGERRPASPVHHRALARRCAGPVGNQAGGVECQWRMLYVRPRRESGITSTSVQSRPQYSESSTQATSSQESLRAPS